MEEWEEPLHPGSLGANITHFLPQCNPICTSSPTSSSRRPSNGQKSRRDRPIRCASAPPAPGLARNPRCRRRFCERVLHTHRAAPRHRRRDTADRPTARRLGRPGACAASTARGIRSAVRAPLRPTRRQPRPHSPRRLARRARSRSRVAATLGARGCGSSHGSGTSVDPATAVPASAPMYVGADVRPTGARGSDALAAGSALTHQATPTCACSRSLRTPGSPALDFSKDVAPWLGPHAGLFLSSLAGAEQLALAARSRDCSAGVADQSGFPFGAGRAQGAIVLDTSDPREGARVPRRPGQARGRSRRRATAASPYRRARTESPSRSCAASR